MRGKAPFCRMSLHPGRITPAYAGKRWTASKKETSRWDHPRICGEKLKRLCQSDGAVGSPPHMRGKEIGAAPPLSGIGITPAYAGKSRLDDLIHIDCEDHPRICGEKCRLLWEHFENMGSPPHMRGKGLSQISRKSPLRITPAYAGKSWLTFTAWGKTADHPRICGEKSNHCCSEMIGMGSPPHMRGKD